MATAGYLFNEKPPAGLLVAQAVGITASTFLFGQNAAISYAFIPAVLKAPAPLAVRQWRTVFDLGRKIGPVLALASSLSFGYVAYNQDSASTPFKLNVIAAVLLPSIIPFTLAFIDPTNKKLDKKLESFVGTALTDKAAEAGIAEEETTHALLDKWATLNLARAGIIGLGAVLGIWAAVDKREAVSFGNVSLSSGANRI
ncbi:hypothetical protein K505DRAFT_275564 [Melanomma pulvis-pyrius CBS 109.77]|uniref:DUF1772-domain-containing protein n=1 Tax=Melanomma pulvis-pyrius CBS 109.77 TaxID=1314802 RepID=A0A6A6XE49_9PLEO|nr:hypothetical protein K505DRAFT_275564 [Melanomma pulvis-pyrius CBS 109.77]